MTQPIAKTPPRNNYANPHTPIANIKRKRQARGRSEAEETPNATLSPMHKVEKVRLPRSNDDGVVRVEDARDNDAASWVGRKVDALFSPVLRMLDNAEEDEPKGEEIASTDTHPSTSSSDRYDDEDEDSLQGQEMPEDDEFNPWQFIQSLPPYSHVSNLTPPCTLPRKDPDAPNLTLVLDLDETLVHCSVEQVEDADMSFPVEFHGQTYQVHVKLRPFLFEFLEWCQGEYEVILFTASQKIYANELLNRIDRDGKYIQYRLYRESCLSVEGNFLKDLNVVGRDLAKTILVDNSPHAFGYQVNNGIPIESWFDDKNDRELLKLMRFLKTIKDVEDVRPVLERKFQCQQLVANAPPLVYQGTE